MASIFRKDDNHVDKPKRNTFDLSSQNNLTTNFGRLTPVFCQEVLPGDSFKIEPTFGLRFMPQVFPVQTRQRASIKYYYCRNRNVWKDWMDFIGKTKDGLVSPYFKFDEDFAYFFRPSGLLDYFGVPIKVDVPWGSRQQFKLNAPWNKGNDITYIPNGGVLTNNNNEPLATKTAKNIATRLYVRSGSYNYRLSDIYGGIVGISDDIIPVPLLEKVGLIEEAGFQIAATPSPYVALLRRPFKVKTPFNISTIGGGIGASLIVRTSDGEDVIMHDLSYAILNPTITINYVDPTLEGTSQIQTKEVQIDSIVGLIAPSEFGIADFVVNIEASSNEDLYWCDLALEHLPWASDVNPDNMRMSAIPFRCWQSIYNALIRNQENNPFIVNGVPEYNKYIVSTDGGAVTTQNGLYDELREWHANWSDDRFTTALPSPQQGNAPLVGLTGKTGATVVLGNEDGTQSTVNLQVDADTGNVVMVEGVASDSPDYLKDAFMSAVEYGITINDLRNVNSFQRWLENNIKRGYKYKDQLMSHYGVSARYDVLDMPEFIGGVSRDVNVSQVTQTVENEFGNLGDYAGQSYIMGEGHSITQYCDEHGFIIGVLEVKPMPLYQDALPKYLIKSDAFDYYFPEFGKIGPQPITNKELAFSQSVLADKADETFGYQRAWYDYLENLDSVHGLFRSDLRNYLIARDFNVMPTLGQNFLTMNNDDVNNTFYVDDFKDKIIGQIYHKVIAKRCIPLIGIPSLE